MNTEKTFEELIIENVSFSDRRKKIFRELKKKLIEEYIQKLCECMDRCEIKRSVFKMDNNPFTFDIQIDYYGDSGYFLIIEDGKPFEGVLVEDFDGKPLSRVVKSNQYVEDLNFNDLNNCAIIELSLLVKDKIAQINKNLCIEIDKAKELV